MLNIVLNVFKVWNKDTPLNSSLNILLTVNTLTTTSLDYFLLIRLKIGFYLLETAT